MNLARVSQNGQITVPIEIRRQLGLKAGDKILFQQNGNGEIVLSNASSNALLKAQNSFSGLAEPVAALLVILIAGQFVPFLPWALAFAAGAMMYVVVEELIPEAKLGEHSDLGTIAVLAGFVLMMLLDTTLG